MTTATKKEIALQLRNKLSELERLSGAVAEFGQRHNLASNELFNLKLALEEVVTNVISHGYGDNEEHLIGVRLFLERGEFTAVVDDDARPFNPLDAPEPDVESSPEERSIGGLGVYLVRKIMEHLEYRRQNDRNVLVLKKKVATK